LFINLFGIIILLLWFFSTLFHNETAQIKIVNAIQRSE
ncbi:MAG: hypothetical protein ACI921_001429, partial [Polaribacter sp.]